MSLNVTDANMLIFNPPFLVSAIGEHTISVLKTDPNELVADLTTELVLMVDVSCTDIPYQEVEVELEAEVLNMF
jgi:hypothetical protein